MLLGEIVCLFTSLLWAVSLTMFRRPIAEHGARSVNLVKCALAATLQGVTVAVAGQAGLLVTAPSSSWLVLGLSGLIGLALGDTALFASVARIGVHRALLLQTLAPVFTAAIAAAWQGERLTLRQAAGAVLILVGVALVVGRFGEASGSLLPGHRWAAAGIALGIVAAFGQGAGVVLAKVGVRDIPVLAASFVRLGAGAAGLAAVAWMTGGLGRLASVLRSRRSLTRVVPATVMGTYLALFLMMAGIAWAPASVAAVLLSTGPVFTLVIGATVGREPLTLHGIAGTLLAMAGVAVLTTV